MSLGVDNTGSDNGSNEIGSSGSTGGPSGSGTTDNCKDDNNCNRADADKFQKELNKSPDESSSGQVERQAGTRCSVSDLYSGTPRTTSSEEEEDEATKAEIDQKERARLGDKAYREQVTTNASPVTHLDAFSRGLSVSGGPPPGVAAPQEQSEAINDTIKNLLDNASNFCPGPNTTIINRDLLNNFLDDYNRSSPHDT